jgi:toxin ParE1/3/4
MGAQAERDFVFILDHTREMFGERQAAIYRVTLSAAVAALEAGPDIPGSASRDEILSNLRTLHVARKGRRGRHFIMYRVGQGQVIEVIRVLYDGMDLGRHIPDERD